nr:hypothetical protein CFP56_01205 [Quercus suber]
MRQVKMQVVESGRSELVAGSRAGRIRWSRSCTEPVEVQLQLRASMIRHYSNVPVGQQLLDITSKDVSRLSCQRQQPVACASRPCADVQLQLAPGCHICADPHLQFLRRLPAGKYPLPTSSIHGLLRLEAAIPDADLSRLSRQGCG